MIRLDKFISDNTGLTRNQTKEIIRKGLVKSDGELIRKTDFKIDPEKNIIEYDGKIISYRKNKYIILNKPAGYVCSTDDPESPTVLELIPPELSKGVFPAGRLDKDSEGLVILTDDGSLAHRIITPSKHIPKIYIVKLAESFKIKYIDLFADGVILGNGETCLPAEVMPLQNNDLWAIVKLYEGKYHQVKRMFAAAGNHVEYLFRFSVGGLKIPEKLAIGGFMEVMHKDVENLLKSPFTPDFLHDLYVYFSSYLINK